AYAEQSVTITVGALTKFAFSSGSTTFTTDDCEAYVIEAQDAQSNAVTLSGTSYILDLSDGGASGVFYSDSGCSTPITQKTIADGTASTGNFYYKNSTAESATLSAAENPDDAKA